MAKPVFQFDIPVFQKLTDSTAWEKKDDSKTRFLAARLHFAVFRVPHPNPRMMYGEPVNRISVRKGSITTHEAGISYTANVTDVYKVTKSALIQSSFTKSISGTIGAQIGVPNLKSIVANATKSFNESESVQFSKCIENNRTVSKSSTITSKTSRTFRDEDCDYVILPQYHEVLYDLHLTWVDYLEVEYSQSLLGIRRKRHKFPEFTGDGTEPPNVLKILTPMATISSWDVYDDIDIKRAGENYDLLEDPNEVSVISSQSIKTPYVEPNFKPSLYRISNAAFPLLWIKQKWNLSEEELQEIEEAERKIKLSHHGISYPIPGIDIYSSNKRRK